MAGWPWNPQLTDENLSIILADCHINLNEPTTPVYALPKAHNPESGPKSQQAPGAEAKPAKPTEPTPVQPKPETEPKPVVTYPTGTNPTQQNGTQTQAQQQAQEDKQKQEQERDKALGREALKKLKEKL